MFLAAKFGLVELNQTFFLQIFNTLVLFAGLSYFLFKPMTAFLEKRAAGIAKSISDAELRNLEADQLKRDYKEKINNIHEEELAIMKEAKQKAEAKSRELHQMAEREIHAMKETARREIEAERARALNELKDEISAIALLAASHVVGRNIDSTGHENLINDFIDKVGDSRWQN
jgi:F-type H+-transporting ATPase subunit b